jgi:hypothetical protein
MPIQLKELNDGKTAEVQLTGKLVNEDCDIFVPAVERLAEKHRRIRRLVERHDFHGWAADALWEDTRFGVHHFRDIDRPALVGEKKWQEGNSGKEAI